MSDKKFSAIRARLKYETLPEFKAGYSKFVSTGGMFIPVPQKKLKPVGTTIRFQFLLADGSTALLGEGSVLQVREPNPDQPRSPVGMLIKFSKLSPESKAVVDDIVAKKDEHKTPTQEVREPIDTPVGQVDAVLRGNDPEPKTDMNVIGEDENYDEEDKTYEMSVDQFVAMQQESERVEEATAATYKADDETMVANAAGLEQPTSPAHDIDPAEMMSPSSAVSEEIRSELAPTPIGDDYADPGPGPVAFDSSEAEDVVGAVIEPNPAVTDTLEQDKFEDQERNDTEPVEPEPAPLHTGFDEHSESAVRVLSYDDMSTVQGNVDFGFSGEESEIDDMFDDLFGSTNNESFFDEVLGTGNESEYESLDPEDLIPASEVSEAFTPEPPETNEQTNDDPDVSQDVSLDDAFESEPDYESAAPAIEAEADNTVSDLFTPQPRDDNPFRDAEPSPIYAPMQTEESSEPILELEPISEEEPLIEAEEESEDEPISQPISEPLFEAFDDDEPDHDSTPAFDPFDDDLIEEPTPFEQHEEEEEEDALGLFDAEPEPGELELGEPVSDRPHEIDNLFEHLNDDVPIGTASSLTLGSAETPAEEPAYEPDEESLEALLALANRDIETKRDEETKNEEGDIFDQLGLGDDLPPPPSGSGASFIPTPDAKKEKKSFISKLFSKD